jgi:glucosamine-6-phosphate deaminase
MERRLFDRVRVASEHIGFLDGRAADLDAECERFERAIEAAGGLDLVVLGIGANGHIGFNEPAPSLVATTHVATLDAPTRAANAWWFHGDLQAVPARALTMGVGTILYAAEIVLMATGPAKGTAIQAAVEGPVTTTVPASLLQLHRDVTVMVDADAAALLTRPIHR